MDGFEGLWFECEGSDEGATSKEQVGKTLLFLCESIVEILLLYSPK